MFYRQEEGDPEASDVSSVRVTHIHELYGIPLTAMPEIDLDRLQTIIDALQREGDRVCAILGLATADALLEDLIRAAMIDDAPQVLFEGHGACSTLSSKVDIAYALGLISSDDRRDLHLLRKIRNEFAHAVNHELGFDDKRIANWIRELTIPNLFKGTPMLQGESYTLRFRFELAVGTITYTLTVKSPHRSSPEKHRKTVVP